MIRCSSCGKTAADDAQFCIECGSKIATVKKEKIWTLGSESDNDIVQVYEMVSGYHCRVHWNGSIWAIQDMESTNGTYINDVKIPPSQMIPFNIGDQISLGSHKLSSHIFASLINTPSVPEESEESLTIGRGPGNDIILDFPQISYQHARLTKANGSWIIEDRNSANGTYVNDRSQRISQCEISTDDILFFGSYKIAARRILGMKKDTAMGRTDPHAITITKAETIFGRDPSATIPLDSPQISWHHAKLIHKKDGFILQDMGSTNGTYVNGHRITSCRVTPQDAISFGSSFVFNLTNDLRKIEKRDYRGDIRLDADGITFEIYDRKARSSKRILDNISLSIFPSEFVGLMGPAGSGKTTLILALNGYLPPTRGCSLINKQSLYENYDAVRRDIGYVPQDDIVHRELTVYEALYYTAKLRLPPDTPDQEISDKIEKLMLKLGLIHPPTDLDIRTVPIGSPEKKGISGGQKRRVMLAMELLTEPSLLFLDEPTSGLSAQDALIVMDILRELADDGKTILLTIHQPSLEIYKKMDNVIIVSSGKLMYYGPTHPDSLAFFNPDRSDEVTNNADSALKGLSERSEEEWQRRYNASDYHREYVTGRRNEQCSPREGGGDVRKSSASSGMNQWWTLTRRYFTVKRKDVVNTLILFLQAPVIAALIALVFKGDYKPETPLFLVIISALWFGISNSAREIVAEKAIYTRERMVNLKISSYVFSKYAVLGLLCLIQCMVLIGTVHPILELKGDFRLSFGVTVLAALAGLSIGMFVSSVTKTQQQAVAFLPLILIPMVILGGGMKPVWDMEDHSRYLPCFMPSRWAYEQIVHIEQEGIDKENEDSENESSGGRFLVGHKTDILEKLFRDHKHEEEVLLLVMLGLFVFLPAGLTMAALRLKDQV